MEKLSVGFLWNFHLLGMFFSIVNSLIDNFCIFFDLRRRKNEAGICCSIRRKELFNRWNDKHVEILWNWIVLLGIEQFTWNLLEPNVKVTWGHNLPSKSPVSATIVVTAFNWSKTDMLDFLICWLSCSTLIVEWFNFQKNIFQSFRLQRNLQFHLWT